MDSVIDEHDDEIESLETETSEYPLKTDHLNKGDRISVETLERAFAVAVGTDSYRLRVLGAQRYVERRFMDRGEPVTTRQLASGELVILTDEEALAYNAKRFELETKQRNRCFVRLSQTDRGQLTDISKGLLDRKVVELGRRVQDDRRTQRELRATPTERSTPASLPGARHRGSDVVGAKK